ncbi:MAG: HAMP domain-containing histidine kinase [Candidatus Gracilibacteria bacterium]|nr:HAMP domain-containing histidine kinase [Candidatus Gracilibacteria bacterium]
MKLKKETKISLKITFLTTAVILGILVASVYASGYLFKAIFIDDFIKGIENKEYLEGFSEEEILAGREEDKKIDITMQGAIIEEDEEDDIDMLYFIPTIDYFEKKDGKILKFGRTNEFKSNLDFLLNLEKGKHITKKIEGKEYTFYNDKNSDKIYISQLFVFEVQLGLFFLGLPFLVILVIPLYFVSRRVVRLYFKPVEEANKRLKYYNHHLAHELKTPITAMSLNLDTLDIEYDKQAIIDSKKELNNMFNIVDSLLKLSEKSVGDNLDIFILKDLIKQYLKTLNNDEKKKIYLDINEKSEIKTDRILFFRILENVIRNGFKYSLDNKIYIKSENNAIIFSNKIKPELAQNNTKRLTDYFYRGKNSENYEGFGLGLSIVETITKQLGYKLNIKIKNEEFILEIKFN